MKRAILVTGIIVLVWAGTALAETVYVRARSAKIRAGQTALHSVLERVPRGTPLEVLERGDRWLLVKTPKGNQGWVYASRTATEKAAQEGGLLARLGKEFRGEAAETAAAAGARGLDRLAEDYAKRAGVRAAHIAAMNRAEKLSARITEQQVEDFLRKGKVGEYR